MAMNAETPAIAQGTLVGANLADSVSRMLSAEGKFSLNGPYVEFAGTDADTTITAAQVVGGFIATVALTAGRTYTLPTAALLVAGVPSPRVGQALPLVITRAGGAFALTVAAGSGGTLKGTAATAATANHGITMWIVLTNITASSEAYIAYSTGA